MVFVGVVGLGKSDSIGTGASVGFGSAFNSGVAVVCAKAFSATNNPQQIAVMPNAAHQIEIDLARVIFFPVKSLDMLLIIFFARMREEIQMRFRTRIDPTFV